MSFIYFFFICIWSTFVYTCTHVHPSKAHPLLPPHSNPLLFSSFYRQTYKGWRVWETLFLNLFCRLFFFTSTLYIYHRDIYIYISYILSNSQFSCTFSSLSLSLLTLFYLISFIRLATRAKSVYIYSRCFIWPNIYIYFYIFYIFLFFRHDASLAWWCQGKRWHRFFYPLLISMPPYP